MSAKPQQSALIGQGNQLKLASGACSNSGKKSLNEDAFSFKQPTRSTNSTKGTVAVIADGVSYASEAAKASRYCVNEFTAEYFQCPHTWSTQHAISQVLAKINNRLSDKNNQTEKTTSRGESFISTTTQRSSTGSQWLSTLSGVIFKSATAHIFHVGDTNICRIRDNKLTHLTQKHNRKLGNHTSVLTRVIGADKHLKVDYQQITIRPGDQFVLTTDGVHEYIDEHTLVELCGSNDSVEKISQRIVRQAQQNASQDDQTCLLVRIDEMPTLKPEEIRQEFADKVIPPPLQDGQILDGFKVIRSLHASSRSHLYLVKEILTERFYMLKAPSLNFENDEVYLQGFIREAWVGAQVKHPAIMRIYPPKTDSKFLYHVCEYIKGHTLRQWMHDHPHPSCGQVRQILEQIANALRIFKRLQIIHRDLKPENLMIDLNGQVKLIDYGTASVAALAENMNNINEDYPLGTVNYIAPETLINLSSSYQSDLFSLGVIAYEMLTGRFPYPTKTSVRYHVNNKSRSIQKWHYRSALDFRNDLPFWLDLALRKAVESDPEIRYQAYSEFITDISTPNEQAEIEYAHRPLIEREPVKFWQTVSILLALLLIISLIF
ncbi:bifunctional protein-serine/threonine kinase/phosphatase [Aliikangiella coralliicola]|uniref:Bifunctional protein-serine/threonine kinase/phosphatase n=1 Tax=Aliikangiella coralliicola TaxID=2592383 RepID=A0A545U648_9GAMM|nr:bifunctional protein-serine/threonine kinase/phosphatase [Aliikangiella coralliicola]TQV84883.1 bifunctional protein-serine/threonine kinase/phosphatase [Aliikangiella coralliicola]